MLEKINVQIRNEMNMEVNIVRDIKNTSNLIRARKEDTRKQKAVRYSTDLHEIEEATTSRLQKYILKC